MDEIFRIKISVNSIQILKVHSVIKKYRIDAMKRALGLKWLDVIGVALITQVTHVRNKNSNIQGRSLNVIEVMFQNY